MALPELKNCEQISRVEPRLHRMALRDSPGERTWIEIMKGLQCHANNLGLYSVEMKRYKKNEIRSFLYIIQFYMDNEIDMKGKYVIYLEEKKDLNMWKNF